MSGVLVRTEKFRQQDLAGEIRPDAVLDSIADLPAWWRAHASGQGVAGDRARIVDPNYHDPAMPQPAHLAFAHTVNLSSVEAE